MLLKGGTSYSDMYKQSNGFSSANNTYYAANQAAERSQNQINALAPPQRLFYDEGYSLDKDPQYTSKLSDRRLSQERERTQLTDLDV
jgi:hypothetical protein